jgi:uncharacterized protein
MIADEDVRLELEDIRRRLEPLLPDMRRRGVTAVYVFGSVLRGEAQADSDVDLFVDYDPRSKFSLLDLVHLREEFSAALDRDADVFTRNGLHRLIRDRVITEAQRIL